MKKLYLIKNPLLFQGEKYLKKNKYYFEGWYFKNTNKREGIAFIPGISLNKKQNHAFVQIITNKESYYISYNINEFKFNHDPFYIKIGDNFFSKEEIRINIDDINSNLKIRGNIKYSNSITISSNLLNPNIMGPFSYLTFMECNHAIISMKSEANGILNINNNKMIFNKDIGYIEKDYGVSFPKYYIWVQGNDFSNESASFMLSVANIPFKCFKFRGFICSLIIDNEEYRFATYNGSKIINCIVNDNCLDITLKNGSYYLYVRSKPFKSKKLIAPVKGRMDKEILESIKAVIDIELKKDNKIIFSDSSKNSGLEVVGN